MSVSTSAGSRSGCNTRGGRRGWSFAASQTLRRRLRGWAHPSLIRGLSPALSTTLTPRRGGLSLQISGLSLRRSESYRRRTVVGVGLFPSGTASSSARCGGQKSIWVTHRGPAGPALSQQLTEIGISLVRVIKAAHCKACEQAIMKDGVALGIG